MALLSKLKEHNGADKKRLEFELPYFMTFITLLASSGFGPYTIFQKLKDVPLLPSSKNESEKILKRIDLLGLDPLTAMLKVKEKSTSKEFADFLSGYVSSIQGGGDVVNYLKSKMESTFERYADIERQSVEKVKTIVEAYMTLQVVILAVYIIINAVEGGSSHGLAGSNMNFGTMFVIVPPLITLVFLLIAKSMNISKLKELDIKKIIIFGIPGIVAALIFISLNFMPSVNGFVLAAALIVFCVWPTITFKKKYIDAIDAEYAAPNILRDIAETRKAGIGPEKCVIRACKRQDYGGFTKLANSIAGKLERGSSLKDIYDSLKKKIENFQVLISFKILFEVISSGGGNVDTIASLAETAEKIHNIEKEKRNLLKPYVMLGFLLIGLTSFTTLLVIDSLTSLNIHADIDEETKQEIMTKSHEGVRIFSISVLIQAWLAGLFLGKITTGSYSGGFQYSIFLSFIALVGIIIVQLNLIDVAEIVNSVHLV